MFGRPRFKPQCGVNVPEGLLVNEFDLIAQYFSRPVPAQFLGGGDDCALLPISSGLQLATSTDLLIEGRHFFTDTDPNALGHKALAVNLSDLAAMGAQPLACLLSLSLPSIDADWLTAFSNGFYDLANASNCYLVGGDTTRSVSGIVISVTVFGQVASTKALRRSGAKVDDDIWISGTLGAADIALRLLQKSLPDNPELLAATRVSLERPNPPLLFAQSLAGVANAALDLSDGLLQDLGHLLTASRCGAELDYQKLPVDPALSALPVVLQQAAVLGGGDVYQLCFTASPQQRNKILALAQQASVRATRVGRITEQMGLRVKDADGTLITPSTAGFDHFN